MTTDRNADIARQAVSGSLLSVTASLITLSLGFIRMTLLLRLLLPKHFGITTLALFYLGLVAQIRGLGIDNAFIHRQEDDEESATRTYFTMRMLLVLGSLLLFAPFVPLLIRLYPEMNLLGAVLLSYMAVSVIKGFNTVQVTVLSKELSFKPLAVTDIISSVTMTIVAPLAAWLGYGIWAIVAEQFSGVASRALAIWLIYRPWRPRLGWNRAIVKEYWHYGIRSWTGSSITYLIDRFDDFWVGTFLGGSPLGFYSRAYEFARYPRRVVANPILAVFFPAFARLQGERTRLSRAFFRPTSLMVRSGAYLSLLAIFTAPEVIPLLLGSRWTPMVVAFQLMVVYTLLDPLSLAATNLLMAIGQPGTVTRIRALQALIFVPAVVILGTQLGIEGVAIAADLMIATGTFFLYRRARQFVDFNNRILWLWPSVGIIATAIVVFSLNPLWTSWSDIARLLAKAAVITTTYGSTLWIFEREELRQGWGMVRGLLAPRLALSRRKSA